MYVFLCMSIFNTTNTIAQVTPKLMMQWRAPLTREAQAIFGINAPVPMFAAQIEQESGGRADITASDLGRGLGQFMDGTSAWIISIYPELGPADPYNPIWAIRAQIKFNSYLYRRVRGKDDCNKFGAALKGYNAGLGFPQRAQAVSRDKETWFTITENINKGQSEKNFVYSRWYPRVILFDRQKHYIGWGQFMCDVSNPPFDKYPFR